MKTKSILLFLLTALLLSACSAVSPATDPLAGTSWQLSAMGEKSPVPGTSVTLEFKGGQAGGMAGCNSYGGAYEVDGEKIAFEDFVSTLMACADQTAMDQESTYLASLGKAQRFELSDGQLQISGPGGETLTFVPAQ